MHFFCIESLLYVMIFLISGRSLRYIIIDRLMKFFYLFSGFTEGGFSNMKNILAEAKICYFLPFFINFRGPSWKSLSSD